MKNFILPLTFVAFLFFSFDPKPSMKDAPDYWLKKCDKKGECGYADASGKFRIPKGKYPMCFTDTFRRMAIVSIPQDGFVGIDRNEHKLFNVQVFDNWPDEPSEGLFRIYSGKKHGFANEDGVVVIPMKYDAVFKFNDSLAAFNIGGEDALMDEYHYTKGGKWGFVDHQGKEVIPAIYDVAYEFQNGEASVKRNDTTYVIDKTGRILRSK